MGIVAERVLGRLGWFSRVEHTFNPMKTDVKAEWECILQSVLLEYGRDLLRQLVDGLPFTDANARSPIPTLTSAFVERGIMAEVGPTVKSSATVSCKHHQCQ